MQAKVNRNSLVDDYFSLSLQAEKFIAVLIAFLIAVNIYIIISEFLNGGATSPHFYWMCFALMDFFLFGVVSYKLGQRKKYVHVKLDDDKITAEGVRFHANESELNQNKLLLCSPQNMMIALGGVTSIVLISLSVTTLLGFTDLEMVFLDHQLNNLLTYSLYAFSVYAIYFLYHCFERLNINLVQINSSYAARCKSLEKRGKSTLIERGGESTLLAGVAKELGRLLNVEKQNIKTTNHVSIISVNNTYTLVVANILEMDNKGVQCSLHRNGKCIHYFKIFESDFEELENLHLPVLVKKMQ
ncbi:hypothetical protein [Photobacterium leiognathi]|uniref:hypothetical protein n=1 Tax=Photobacterium leiognathi TaxID=553611 RepID=UPI002982025A|nr:hypothetical protein [Photobacterium leiognathi]